MLLRTASFALALALVAHTGRAAAQAAPPRFPYGPHLLSERGFIYVDHPDVIVPEPGVAHAPPSRILYLNDCKPSGCLIEPSDHDDSRHNLSSIVGTGRHTLAPYSGSDAAWQAIVACVRENYAPFTIQVVTTDPGDVPHYEAFAAGLPADVGFPSGVAGVASFSCGIIPDAVSFSFLNLDPENVDDACWTISQESAHNFGLSHSMLSTDAMTYLPQPPRKRFVDALSCIGTQGCCLPMGECRCGLTDQNSFQRLTWTFGAAGATPPDIWIDEPNNTATVRPGFAVRATVADWDGVDKVELLVDDVVRATATAAPYAFTTPADLAAGEHRVVVRATDRLGLAGQVLITVNVVPPCTTDESCGAGRVCGDDGNCVAAPPPADEGGGCASGGAPTWPVGLGLLVGLGLRRRRARA